MSQPPDNLDNIEDLEFDDIRNYPEELDLTTTQALNAVAYTQAATRSSNRPKVQTQTRGGKENGKGRKAMRSERTARISGVTKEGTKEVSGGLFSVFKV